MMKTDRPLRVAELFAGVGGFRLGLERVNGDAGPAYRVVWSNQWEPALRAQHASDLYVRRFGREGHSNEDIAKVPVEAIPDHDLLVGGFPCQDYSVARTLNQASGLQGKKGVLWWEIHRILQDKGERRPQFVMLENVDRLLKSPASQRGRDFAVMVASLLDLGYAVEWRVINAADYGMPQRRRRVFVLGYLEGSAISESLRRHRPDEWLGGTGVISTAFPVSIKSPDGLRTFTVQGDLAKVSAEFNSTGVKTPFGSAGLAALANGNRTVWTADIVPQYQGPRARLRDVLLPDSEVPQAFHVDPAELEQWRFLKGAKSLTRTNRTTNHTYQYQEGGMAFPDDLEGPSRTIVTGEGGRTPSRFKHIIEWAPGQYRRLTPVELERLNMFPDDHTAGVSDVRRAFLMGNALVVGVVEHLGRALHEVSLSHSERPIEDRTSARSLFEVNPA